MPLSKGDLARGIIIGIIVGLILGYYAGRSEIENIKSQISGLEFQIEQLRRFAPPLRALAEKCGIYIGAAVEPDYLTMDYAETLSREFNIMTTENVLKFGPVHPQRDAYSFTGADRVIEFAEAHGMKVRGHTLVWHSQLPSWITTGRYTREEWIEILREHIMTVVGRYKGRIYAWDVVNEAVDDSGTLRNTLWLQNIGPEYIELAFTWAHEADPNALLFYNDYGAEGLGTKSNAVYNLVKGLLEKGVPIHGVGLQMHISVESPPSPQDIAANIKRLNDLGLDVHVTEMDVRVRTPASQADLIRQAEIYRDVLDVCLSASKCTAFVMWGFTDRYSWIPGTFGGYGSALIFDETYKPKPAYYYMLQKLIEYSSGD